MKFLDSCVHVLSKAHGGIGGGWVNGFRFCIVEHDKPNRTDMVELSKSLCQY